METFTVKLQGQNRIVIPQAQAEILKLKKGDKLRVSVEKVR
jgi:bifunctional DNA-binding transcriptional regulator/antitoxin component of YhaV-PrlF toxin-antitoxin module